MLRKAASRHCLQWPHSCLLRCGPMPTTPPSTSQIIPLHVMGFTTQPSATNFYDDLGPGTIQGGGDMWIYWNLDPAVWYAKASTYIAADDKWGLTTSLPYPFTVD